MKQIYVVRKYVLAESVAEAVKKEKEIAVADCYLTDHSTVEHLESLQPRKEKAGFKEKKS